MMVSLAVAVVGGVLWWSQALWWQAAATESFAMAPSPVPAVKIAAADESARLEATQRYLKASAYVSLTRTALQRMAESAAQQTQQDPVTPQMRKLFDADPAVLEQALAPVLASRLTLDQAQQIASFYESAAGRFVVAESKATGSSANEKQALTLESDIRAFFEGPAATALMAVLNDPVLVEMMVLAAQMAPLAAAGQGS